MKTIRGIGSCLFACVITTAAAACSGGGGAASLMPTGPSGTGSPGGAQISGRVSGLGAASGSAAVAGFSGAGTNAFTINSVTTTSVKVTVSGTGISTSVDGAGQFTLDGVPAGTVVLTFSGPGVNASVTISGVREGDRIQIEVRLEGAGARIESEQRRRDETGRVEIEGRITAIGSEARTIRVKETLVHVPESARIRRGSRTLQFADLAIGASVEIHGTRDGSTIRATEVNVEDEEDDGDHDEDEVEIRGAVSALAGTCPALTFTLGERHVKTSSATVFKDMHCSAIRNTVRLEVKGRVMADRSLAATRVEIED